jgi:hypothetical protein
MTKKHFIALAQEIAGISDRKARLLAAQCVCNVGQRFNPSFDRVRFFQACGLIAE